MSLRSDACALSKDEIISRLEESDIDLSDNEEKDDTAYTPIPEEDEGSSTSSYSSLDEEADSQSEVSLQSSIVRRGGSRGRKKTNTEYHSYAILSWISVPV